jgi:hypothetical protein
MTGPWAKNGEHSSNATSLSTLCVAAGTSECASAHHMLQNAVVVAFNSASSSFPYFIDCSKDLFNVGACRKVFAERRRAELFRHYEIDLGQLEADSCLWRRSWLKFSK